MLPRLTSIGLNGARIRPLGAWLALSVGLLLAAWYADAIAPAFDLERDQISGGPQFVSANAFHCHGDGHCCHGVAADVCNGHSVTWIAAGAMADSAVGGGVVFDVSTVNAPLGRASEPLLHPPSA